MWSHQIYNLLTHCDSFRPYRLKCGVVRFTPYHLSPLEHPRHYIWCGFGFQGSQAVKRVIPALDLWKEENLESWVSPEQF